MATPNLLVALMCSGCVASGLSGLLPIATERLPHPGLLGGWNLANVMLIAWEMPSMTGYCFTVRKERREREEGGWEEGKEGGREGGKESEEERVINDRQRQPIGKY